MCGMTLPIPALKNEHWLIMPEKQTMGCLGLLRDVKAAAALDPIERN
jgi:hypothetical protein